jgi:ATP-binding cassette, subfamily B, multidrug efflux pump
MMRPPAGDGRGPAGAMAARGGPMAASMPVSRARDFRGAAARLVRRFRPEWPVIMLVVALTAVGVSLTILGPRILGNATNLLFDGVVGRALPAGVSKAQVIAALRARGQDQMAAMLAGMDVTPGHGVDFAAFGSTLGLAALVYLLGAAFTWAQGYLMAGVAQRVLYGMRHDVEDKLARLPLSYFDREERGDLLSRVTNDIDNIGTTLQQSLGQLLNSLLTIVGVLAMMFSISPTLASISLAVVPLSAGVTFLIARRSQRRFVQQWRWTGRLNAHVEEMHTGHALVQVFGHRHESEDEFERLNRRLFRSSFLAQFLSGVIQPAMQLVSNLNYVAIAVIGGYRVATGTMSLGDVQAFIQYSRQFTMPIAQIAGQMNLLQSGVASAERVFQLLDAAEEVRDGASPARPGPVRGEVRFDHVSFRYAPEEPLIEDFDLLVEPGRTVAIVGPTGAGKTTVVNLLMRFYDVEAGAIRLDGADVRDLRRDDLRRAFGMVLQDSWLFSGTIRDNIAYGREGATDEDVVAAARAAHFDRFVRTLPDGYDALLDDEASNLSAGERQLLTIARAFVADPAVLILDEATSSVDTRTEVLIQEAMARLRQGRTSFVIAHRLSTIRNADTIIVMDHGRIVERGSHEELLAAGGFYHRLYRSQFTEAFAEV